MEISEKDWPVHYLPHTILADRGSELISNELTSIVENLHIKIQNTGPFRPELKGVCEVYFSILQQHLSPFLLGTVQKDFGTRGGQDYRKKAVLNIKEYSRILVRCIIYHNSRFLKDYLRTQNMIEEKVPPIPLEIFKWGLNKGNGQLRTMTFEQIRSNVLPKSEATINAKGICFSGLYYSSATAVKDQWFSHARIHGSYKITIQYDPQDMSKIYIRHDRKNYEVCFLIDQYEMYRSAVMEEVNELRRDTRQQEAEFEGIELNGRIKLAQEIEEIVKNAKGEAKLGSLNGKVQKNIKDIRQNRKVEQELLREVQSSQNETKAKEKGASGASLSKSLNNLDLFRVKQKEGLNYEND